MGAPGRGQVIRIVVDVDTWETRELRALTSAAVARYATTQPEIARARRILVEAYRRLTETPTPPAVVRTLDVELDALERWLSSAAPHIRQQPRRRTA